MIVALAGRRVDAEGTKESKFPIERVERVGELVRRMLETESATAIVSSAAAGADLIALVQAGALGLRRRIVLPFNPERFRKASVTDRPGAWGTQFDEIVDAVDAAGDLVVLQNLNDDEAYVATNHAIIDEANRLAADLRQPVCAALIWDGKSRGPGDITEEFGVEARRHGIALIEVKTI